MDLHCKRCGLITHLRLNGEDVCQKCERDLGGFLHGVAHPLPTPIKHDDNKSLKQLGCPCPYCHGTTGIDSYRCVAFCYSCDATFDLSTRQFLGVMSNIGIR
jgi:hypothetical protein